MISNAVRNGWMSGCTTSSRTSWTACLERVRRMRRPGPIDHEGQGHAEPSGELWKRQLPLQQHPVRSSTRHRRDFTELDPGGAGIVDDLGERACGSHTPRDQGGPNESVDAEGPRPVGRRLLGVRPDHLEIGRPAEPEQLVARAVADVAPSGSWRDPQLVGDGSRCAGQIVGCVDEMVDHHPQSWRTSANRCAGEGSERS